VRAGHYSERARAGISKVPEPIAITKNKVTGQNRIDESVRCADLFPGVCAQLPIPLTPSKPPFQQIKCIAV
jgi:hypothetical protein